MISTQCSVFLICTLKDVKENVIKYPTTKQKQRKKKKTQAGHNSRTHRWIQGPFQKDYIVTWIIFWDIVNLSGNRLDMIAEPTACNYCSPDGLCRYWLLIWRSLQFKIYGKFWKRDNKHEIFKKCSKTLCFWWPGGVPLSKNTKMAPLWRPGETTFQWSIWQKGCMMIVNGIIV